MAGERPLRVLLLGFMASGKTTVGRELAVRLGWRFHDFDAVVEGRAGASVSEIFERWGEAHFRALEAEVARELLLEEHVVLAAGGGWPAQPGSWDAVPERTLSVWLRVSPGVAVRRACSEGPVRPLLAGRDPAARAVALLKRRKSSYGKAQVSFDSDVHDPAAMAAKIEGIVRVQADAG